MMEDESAMHTSQRMRRKNTRSRRKKNTRPVSVHELKASSLLPFVFCFFLSQPLAWQCFVLSLLLARRLCRCPERLLRSQIRGSRRDVGRGGGSRKPGS
ncbi:hypothetical protein DPEC_G00023270 [Dallia pectoralis]|uniref:Uncharacterized protein n=1 Tax=Dallia pectoralis TaxID=75939 RepID=A0ACC2HGP4_DALPE|nr:hypothetical protein DPEC_G00023270 [Dallia pectoralis]